MAIWQFTVGLVPRAWAEAEGSVPAKLYDADGYTDMSVAWRDEQLDVDIDDLMSRVLPAAASWGDESEFGVMKQRAISRFAMKALPSSRYRFASIPETVHRVCAPRSFDSHGPWTAICFFQGTAR